MPQSTETFINPAPHRLQRGLSMPLRALRGHPGRGLCPLWQKRKQENSWHQVASQSQCDLCSKGTGTISPTELPMKPKEDGHRKKGSQKRDLGIWLLVDPIQALCADSGHIAQPFPQLRVWVCLVPEGACPVCSGSCPISDSITP